MDTEEIWVLSGVSGVMGLIGTRFMTWNMIIRDMVAATRFTHRLIHRPWDEKACFILPMKN